MVCAYCNSPVKESERYVRIESEPLFLVGRFNKKRGRIIFWHKGMVIHARCYKKTGSQIDSCANKEGRDAKTIHCPQ